MDVQQCNAEKAERYKRFLEQMRHEQNVVWHVFSVFLLPQTIFLAFLLSVSFGKEGSVGSTLGIIVASIVGLILCVLWLVSYVQCSRSYHFRAAQARDAEPKGRNLMSGDGKKFSDGEWVEAGGKCHQIMPIAPRALRVRYTVPLVIFLFMRVYAVILGITVLS